MLKNLAEISHGLFRRRQTKTDVRTQRQRFLNQFRKCQVEGLEDRSLMASFQSGNLALLVSAATTSNTTASIVEINTTAAAQTAVQTIAIPGAGTDAYRISGSASSTGYVARSNDGSLLAFTGANSTDTAANVNTLNPRAVFTLNNEGTITKETTYTGSSSNQARGASSLDNSAWYIGDQGGFYTNGATTASPTGNIRGVKAFGGTIYGFTSSVSAAPVGTISAATGGTFVALPGLGNGAGTRQDFYLISSGENGSVFDVLYVMDANSGTVGTVFKYSLVDTNGNLTLGDAGDLWTANGSYATNFGGFGLAAQDSGAGADLFVSSGTGAAAANTVRKLTDAAGYNVTVDITTANNVTLYTSAAGTIIKGLDFVPVAAAPSVTSPTSDSITDTTATLGGTVSGIGITARGVVYSLASASGDPVIGGPGVGIMNDANSTTGAFSFNVSGLVATTNYKFRAYATNGNGTSYSPLGVFTTQAPTAAHQAPAGIDKPIAFNEDATYTFATADFAFTDSDAPAQSLNRVRISTLPALGTLTLGGNAIAAGDFISLAAIPTLVYTPVAGASGTPYSSFTFQVEDTGSTVGGGQILDVSPNTITFNVNSVNDAPAGTDKTVLATTASGYTFTATDFGFSDVNDAPPNSLLAVKITTLPTAGTLKNDGVDVTVGQNIPIADLTAFKLVFTPASGATAGSAYATFTFQVQDTGTTANGGVDLDPTPNSLTIDLAAATSLAAGDIAVIGYNTSGSPDSFTILILKDLAGGTSFFINDNEVANAGDTAFTDLGEGEASFTVKAGQTIPAGTVVTLPWGSTAVSTATYDYSSTSGFGLGNNNEELYIYTAPAISATTPTVFIYGAKIGTSPSALPGGLTSGTTFISPNGTANRYKTAGVQYSGTQAELLASIGDTANNWEGVAPVNDTDWTFTLVGADNSPVNNFPLPSPGTEETAIVFAGMSSISVTDDSASVTTTISVLSATADGVFTANNGGSSASVSTSNGGATITFVGSPTAVTTALGTLVFTPVTNRNTTEPPIVGNPLTITMTTTDGSSTPDTDTINLIINEINDRPVVVVDMLADVNEDSPPVSIPVATLLGNDSKGASPSEDYQTLTISPSFTNQVGGTAMLVGSNVIFTPTPNYSGPASFEYTVTDNGTNAGVLTARSSFGPVSFTINSVNDVPSFTKGADQTVAYNAPGQTIPNWAMNISAGGGETGQVLTFNVLNDNNSLFTGLGQPAISSTGTLTFTPAPNMFGQAIVTVTLSDNGGTANGGVDTSVAQTFIIRVNSPGNAPTINAIGNVTVNEDNSQVVNFSGVTDGGDPVQQTITITASSDNTSVVPNPLVTYTSPATSGSLNIQPAANANGTAIITVTVRDSGLSAVDPADDLVTTTTFTVTVTSVNDRPTFTAVNPLATNEDSGPVSVPNFATGFIAGPADESTQTVLNYSVSNIVGTLTFAANPAVASDGTLTYTPATNSFGTATFDLTVTDNGGNANGGQPTSVVQSFTITVNPVNDAPTISVLGNRSVSYSAPAQTVNSFAAVVSVGPANEAGQTVTYNVSNNLNSLFAAGGQPAINSSGVLTFTPAPNTSGTATVTVVGQDSGGTANGGVNLSAPVTFTITVNDPLTNALPTINNVSDLTILEGAGPQTINLSGITDGGDTPAQVISVTATSTNSALVPLAVNYTSPNSTGTLTFTSPVNGNGSSTITVTVRDTGLDLQPNTSDDGQQVLTFVVNVTAVNDQPTFTATSPAAVNEDSGAQAIPGFITNFNPGPSDESSQTVLGYTVSGISNSSLFAVLPTINTAGQLSYTPAANAFGTSTFQVTVRDSGGTTSGGVDTSAPQTFTITVNGVNDAPSFTVGPNRTVANTAGAQSFSGQATGISAGPSEPGQTVTFNITGNTNSAIFATPPSIASNGTLTFTPALGASGTATITFVAVDNGGTGNGGTDTSAPQSFTISVAANNPPTIDAIGNRSVNENVGPQSVPLTGITAGGESQTLVVTATSSVPALIPNPLVSYTSPSTTGNLVFAPVAGQTGSTLITVTVRDAGFDGTLNTPDDGLTSTSFTVQVNPVNDPPVANDKTISTVINTPVSNTLSASDPDSPVLIYDIVANPALGMLTSFDPATGAFTYTPAPNATGLDLFTFRVSDGEFTDTGMIRITIQGTQAVVTPSGGDLIVIGTPDPDTIIITRVSAGTVRVRTNNSSGTYPLENALIVNSGQGNDNVTVSGITAPTTIDLGEGDDYGSSGNQNDTIIGGAGNDKINASGGENILWGDFVGEQDLATGGDDVLSTLGGNDVVYGGGGNDQIFSGAGNDYVNAGQGDDIVSAGDGNDRVFGGAGADQLYGGEGADIISGGSGGDIVVGHTGGDILIGGTGADTINGNEGADLLVAGDTTNSASSTAGDANDAALMAMLASWTTSRPAGLASGVVIGNDGSSDSLLGFTGDDDFYTSPNDQTTDFRAAFMGDDRRFSV